MWGVAVRIPDLPLVRTWGSPQNPCVHHPPVSMTDTRRDPIEKGSTSHGLIDQDLAVQELTSPSQLGGSLHSES